MAVKIPFRHVAWLLLPDRGGYGEGMTDIDPERALMLAYVPADRRPAIAALWALDHRLGMVLSTTTEPAIGAIRLVWWRDALRRLDQADAPAEPLLREVAERLLPHLPGAMLASLAEGWGAVIDDDQDEDAYARHGVERGATLFAAAAMVLGDDPDAVRAIGAGWALVDLAYGTRDPALRKAALDAARRALAEWDGRVPRVLRPLGMLGMLARIDAAAGPDGERRPGAPGRVARMMRYRMFGR